MQQNSTGLHKKFDDKALLTVEATILDPLTKVFSVLCFIIIGAKKY